ncbi:MAG: 30S ribosomal protein S9 [Alphaproteobacteria bacterium]|nr:30S ribosomal protein S9 [Alphaproteobacteria bacterium]
MTKKYIEAIGRRKTAIARVRITDASKTSAVVNEKSIEDYFPIAELRHRALSTLEILNTPMSVSVKVNGGGYNAQADAIRLGIARALISIHPGEKKKIKSYGHLTRDSRKKERKHPGFRKARRSPQWSKR